ncbi:MAG: hypothetical protein PHX14_09245 [Syntrophomonadaceae bacterium]|nr:hypothetical protein [Syntrophomonadaceae bacterium]
MKNLKKFMVVGAMAVMITAASTTAYAAANYNTPAEAAAGLTGRTTASVVAEKVQTGKTYGAIAREANVLTQFQAEVKEIQKNRLSAKVAANSMTQERANQIINALQENQANCDGTNQAQIGKKLGAGFGAGKGMNNGIGRGQGAGKSSDLGQGSTGMGYHNGTGLNQ